MNRQNKIIGAAFVAGMLVTSVAGMAFNKIKSSMTPTESFVEAKSIVASAYDVPVGDVKLFRHDFEDRIWEEVMDTDVFGDSTGIYPGYVYTATVGDSEQVLAVQLGTCQATNIRGVRLCGKYFDEYDVTFPNEELFRAPFFVTQVNVCGIADINSVIDGINTEISK